MLLMRILKNLLQYRNRYIYIAFCLVLYLLIRSSLYYIVLLPFFALYIIKNHSDLLLIIVVILSCYTISLLHFNHLDVKRGAQYIVKVKEVTKKEDYTTFIGEVDNVRVKITTSDLDSITVGDSYLISGELEVAEASTIPSGFNYYKYLLSKKVKYTMYNPDLTYINHSFSINQLRGLISDYIEQKTPLSKDYIKTFVLADKQDIDQELQSRINTIGISHLFAVSGFHIALLVLSLDKLLSKAITKEITRQVIISIFLLTFLVITVFTPSVLRAALMYIFIVVNKRYKLELSTLDILSIIFLLVMIANPYSHYNIGFVLSFLVTLFILLALTIINDENMIYSLFKVGVISYLSTIPIIMNLNHEINLLTILFNVIFVLLMSYIVLPLNYITFIFPFLDKLNSSINNLYNEIIMVASNIDLFIIKGTFTSPLFTIIYFFLLLMLLIRFENKTSFKRDLIVFIVFFVIAINSNYFELSKRVVFLDVKGDSTLITDNFNNCNILIDTGEQDPYHSVLGYIESRNIKKLDYVIITHNHSDHYGELETISSSVDIDSIITNKNVTNFEDSLISCGSLSFYIYPMSYESNNENNNSIILSLFINNDSYLFTGDIEESREAEFVNRYSIQTTYLKVPHHGSNTSSSIAFINEVSPQVAIISATENYRKEHPSEEVVNNYFIYGVTVEITRDLGTIEHIYIFTKEKTKYHIP